MTGSPSTPTARRSRLPRWFKRGLLALLVVANLAVFALYWQLRGVETAIDEGAEIVEVPQLTPTLTDKSAPLTFLMIGSDSREGLDDLTNFGPAGGQRADVIILVKVYPDEDRAQMLSIPRDLYVDIPGHGKQKINAAYALGGAQLMVETVKTVTGLPVNHYMEVGFVGFKAIVDEMGGVPVYFPYPARDQKSGLNVGAGVQELDGKQALAFARSRTYQENQNGKWTSVDANDIGRTRRQQQLIFSILGAMRRPSNLLESGSIVNAFAQHLAMDSGLADASLIELAFRMRGISPDRIEAATLPTRGGTVGEQSILLMVEDSARTIEAFRTGASLGGTTDRPMKVTVLNGNGIAGSAAQYAGVLEADGFSIVDVTDATSKDFAQTIVLVRPGETARGATIVQALGFGIVQTGSFAPELDALVILGKDIPVASSG